MDIGTIVTLLVCLAVTSAIVYTMYIRSSAYNFLRGEDDPTKVETFKTEKDSDEMYANRLFVLKMYETLGKKPNPSELDRIAALGGRVEIMQHLVQEEEARGKNIEKFEENVVVKPHMDDDDEIFGPVDDEEVYRVIKKADPVVESAPVQKYEPVNNKFTYSMSDDQLPSIEPVIEGRGENPVPTQGVVVKATHRRDGEHMGKRYIRDMFMLLGRLDASLV
jgi:hypothetical protein